MAYLDSHLRILSSFYGILMPFDGIREYRLDFNGLTTLYQFWGDLIYRELFKDKDTIINLASKEYSILLEKYLQPTDVFINVNFLNLEKGQYKVKSTFSKMARGSLTRYMAENDIEDVEAIKKYNGLGFAYCQELSNNNSIVFVKDNQ